MSVTVDIGELVSRASFRGRAAFVVSLATSVGAGVLSGESAEAATAALDACWNWIEGGDLTAASIHQHIAPLAGLEVRSETSTESSALCAVATAVYYTAWTSYSAEIAEKRIDPATVPNDMFDVTDQALEEACQYALETGVLSAGAINSLATRVAHASRIVPPEQTGPPIRRRAIQ